MEELLAIVTTMLPRPIPEHLPLLMGIDGPGGAGKSTFATALARRLQQERISVTIVRMDDFFSPIHPAASRVRHRQAARR